MPVSTDIEHCGTSIFESANSINISVVCVRATTSKNKAKFFELPLDELEKSYDPE